jgi:invasion protein IalB
MRRAAILGCGFAALALLPGDALAQNPQRTTATYQDWTLRCESRDGPPPARSCEIVQTTSTQGQPNPVTQIAIGRAGHDGPMRIVFQVPVNVLVAAGVALVYDAKSPPLAVAFRHCIPVGCFADGELKDEVAKKFRSATAQAHFEFKDSAQRVVNIPVSFKGFEQAFDALSKQ